MVLVSWKKNMFSGSPFLYTVQAAIHVFSNAFIKSYIVFAAPAVEVAVVVMVPSVVWI